MFNHTHTYISIFTDALITALSEQLHITWDLAKGLTWQPPLSVGWKEKSLHYRCGGTEQKESGGFYVRPWPQPGGIPTTISRENNLLLPHGPALLWMWTQVSKNSLHILHWILLCGSTHWENFRTDPHGSMMPCLELLANCTVEEDRWAHPDKLICVAEIKTDKPVLGAMMGHLHILTSFLM